MFARGGMANLEFARDQQTADAILDQVSILLWREVSRRLLQPIQDQQAIFIGQSAEDCV